ncbi:MAG: FAD-binding oxidoreductase [Microthrixaceae bacterium]
MSDPAALTELSDLLGPTSVLTDPAELTGHVTPWRGPVGEASAVVFPSDTGQVRQVVGWARRHRVRLIPQGANTGLVGASTPPPGSRAVVLSTDHLRGSLHVDPVDRTAVAHAGVRLSELNRAAEPHGLHLPIDLAADPSLGGMVATNTGGTRMLRHGDMRTSLLGLRAVLADEGASVVDELTTLRKHNVGPSVGELLVGAGGAFAVITEVAVQLRRIPDHRVCAWLAPRSTGDVIPSLQLAETHCAAELSAFEVVSAAALDAACALDSVTVRPFGSTPPPTHSVLVELEGAADVEARLVDLLARLDERGHLTDAVVMPSGDAWAVRHGITEGLSHRGTVVGMDVSVPRPRLPELIERVRRTIAGSFPGAELCDFGHWGDGGVHCNVVFPDPSLVPPDQHTRRALRDLVLDIVDGLGGSFSAEHGIGPWNADRWRRATSAGTRVALRALAQAADPLGIMGHPGLPYVDGQGI